MTIYERLVSEFTKENRTSLHLSLRNIRVTSRTLAQNYVANSKLCETLFFSKHLIIEW